jgi:uncharacterized radical SAM superfamily Fe-S cluster-containing enzyme
MKELKQTDSICPECLQLVEATIYEEYTEKPPKDTLDIKPI